jgi:hypothetical protein
MMQLEVRDFVMRGCVASIDLYHAHAPEEALTTGVICSPSQVRGEEIQANANKTQIIGERLGIDSSFIFPVTQCEKTVLFLNHQQWSAEDVIVVVGQKKVKRISESMF